MRVVFVQPFYSDDWGSPSEVLQRFPLIAHLPPAVRVQGHKVRVLLHAPYSARHEHDGVVYEFIRSDPATRLLGRALYSRKARFGPAYFEPAWRIVARLRRLRPDVVHFSGLTMDVQLALIGQVARGVGVKVVVQFHGGEPDRGAYYRRLQDWNGPRLDRVLFTTPEQAAPWIAAGVLRPEQTAQLIESSSPFKGLDRTAARNITGMHGAPVCLSAGTLTEIKDPFTMIRGFERIAAVLPDARLYLYYTRDDMLAEIRQFVEARSLLRERVELRGRAPLAEMEAIYSSADFLLQASLREWTGFAIIEAMSCRCIPIVTDIPSLRMLTGGGKFGRLFPDGDADALAGAVLGMPADGRERLATEAQAYFRRTWSFEAMAARLDAVYRGTAPPLVASF